MLFSQPLSFNQPVVTRLFNAAVRENKLAPAYILAGGGFEDKWQLVCELACYFNCSAVKSGSPSSCAVMTEGKNSNDWCTSCRWLLAEQHPQALLKLSGKENKSGKISVEQARLLVEEISKTSSYHRVVFIDEASQEILHRPAANTLLKTVEEPRTNTVLIFCAQSASDVLPTIVSRCQVINMSNSLYKQGKFFSLHAGGEKSMQPMLDTLLKGSEEEQKNVLNSLEKFSRKNCQFVDAINLADNIQALVKDNGNLEAVLDFLMLRELLRIKNCFTNENEARFAKEIYLLNQITKEQSKHYVGHKALVETFVFAWYKLNQTGINPIKVRG